MSKNLKIGRKKLKKFPNIKKISKNQKNPQQFQTSKNPKAKIHTKTRNPKIVKNGQRIQKSGKPEKISKIPFFHKNLMFL